VDGLNGDDTVYDARWQIGEGREYGCLVVGGDDRARQCFDFDCLARGRFCLFYFNFLRA